MVESYCINIDFAQYKDLRGEAKRVAGTMGLTGGLVAIKTYWPLRVEIVPIKGSPTDFIRGLAKAEGIDKIVAEALP